ncbi:asparaginase, partial [Streptococcus pluranimalium]
MTKNILVLHTGGTISMTADEMGHVNSSNDNPMNHVAVELNDFNITT